MAVNEAVGAGGSNAADRAEVVATVEDYFLGWYDADPERMGRALHPDLAKRSHVRRGGEPPQLRAVTAGQMIGWTGEGEGRETDPEKRRLTIVVDDIHDSIATARVESTLYREFIHLVRTPDGWRIANTLWTWSDPTRHPD